MFMIGDVRGKSGARSMTLLGNFVEMSGQEEHDPFKWNKRSGRSMRGKNQRLHQEGMGSRTASHAVHTPPIHPLFSLFSCPYKISQQSHQSAPTGDRIHVFICA